MENQSSSDLEQTKSEETSTSLVGQLLTLGIPNLKLVYEGEDATAIVHIDDGKYVIHSELKKELTPKFLEKIRYISDCIDVAFKEKGIKKLHTWATNDEEERFNQFLGYRPTGEYRTMFGYDGDIIEYEKDL